jgi:hypothetical protein
MCFGPYYVYKINQIAAMAKDNFFYNIIPAMSIIYQLFFMLVQQCHIDNTINDLLIFCWNTSCFDDLEALWENFYMHVFYMTRTLNDLVIVIFEASFDSDLLNDTVELNALAR